LRVPSAPSEAVELPSRPASLRRPRLPALASPRGVAVRFRVLPSTFVARSSGSALPLRSRARKLRALRSSSGALAAMTCINAAILSYGSALLQGLLPEASPRASRLAATSPGVSRPSAPSTRGVHRRRASHVPASFRLQGFAPSCRLPPPRASRACFIPEALLGFALQGFLLPRSRAAFPAVRAFLTFASGALPPS
jgi:hypothetical protein